MSLLQFLVLFAVLAMVLAFGMYIRSSSSETTRIQAEALRRQQLALKGIYHPEDDGKH